MGVCWACKGTGDIPIAGMLAAYPRKPCEVCKGTGTSNKSLIEDLSGDERRSQAVVDVLARAVRNGRPG